MIKFLGLLFFTLICSLFLKMAVFASTTDGTIDTNYKYAWGEKLGWLNFGCDTCNVHINSSSLTGYFWSKQAGWINLSPAIGGVTNNCSGQLGGYAWSSQLGWIDFSGITIDSSGKFSGASGASTSTAGRVNFSCSNCDVRTDWRSCSESVVCGDGSIGGSEACDDGANNGVCPKTCSTSCTRNSCGSGGGSGAVSPPILPIIPIIPPVDIPAIIKTDIVAATTTAVSTSTIITKMETTTPIIMATTTATTTIIIEPVCSGADFNHDHFVDSLDFSILLAFWKTNYPHKNSCVDINGDKKVNSVDFSILLYQWNTKR